MKIIHTYQKLVLQLLPSTNWQDVNEERKEKLFAHSVVLGTLFTMGFLPLYFYIELSEAIYIVMLLILAFPLAGIVFKVSANRNLAGNLFSFFCYISMLGISVFSNGIYSPAFPYLLASIVSAFWYTNKRFGYYWTALVGLTVMVVSTIHYLEPGFFANKFALEHNLFFHSLTSLGLFIYVLIVVITYERSRDHAFRQLNLAYAEIQDQHEELKQQTEEIQQQRDLLNEKSINLERAYLQITDSVHYAKRIQNAVLGPTGHLQKYFPEAFNLFIPRDIVSGDFYWFGEYKDLKIIIVADCTGHGVPGAIMTIMGHAIFNEIINEKGITQPDQILEYANDTVNASLRKDGESQVHDGMDAVVVTINESSKEIKFSGAKNPIYHFHNKGFNKIKGSKFPIGASQYRGEIKFDLHSYHYESNDMIYLASDGFQDQFGGPKFKKYLVKRFYSYLNTISTKPAAKQKELLEQEFHEWKGIEKQTDDVLVIGIRLS